ncbi:aLK and LTK ligand 2a [Pholidichthys leucotaenia]
MSALRGHLVVALALLMCAFTKRYCECAPSAATTTATAGAAARGGAQRGLRRVVEIVRRVEQESRGRAGVMTAAPLTSRPRSSPAARRDFSTARTDRWSQAVVLYPTDLRKEKFLIYLTGPLYFSPKCRKSVHRVYHHTRDCTIPAYFKRCARLLTRLAGSPQCTEG